MVHENMVETTGISTQSLMMRKKKCENLLLDFIPSDLNTSAGLQNYIRGKLGLPASCIIIGSQLPRGVGRLGLTREITWHESSNFLEEVDLLVDRKHRSQRLEISMKIPLPNRLKTQD